jgi:hypothetical protein
MRLPKDIISGNYTKPRIFLCETNKEKICQLSTTNTNGSFKFNAYSELSFEVARIYNDTTSGKTKVNPYFDKIESPRLIYLENFAYFELQGPDHDSDGIKESKTCTCYSLEYTLSTKFLENFFINTGKVDSLEVLNADDPEKIVPIVLYNQSNPKLSLLHLALEKVYGWKIGHIDDSLKTLSRQFEISRQSVYDFLMTEVCEKFNCYIVFDTINNEINIYAEFPTAKFIGDGQTEVFIIKNANPTFSSVKTVSIDGYKTLSWEYGIDKDTGDGILVLEEAPSVDAVIEAVGVDATWETDVFVTFDNLSRETKAHYDADEIKTVLTVTYGDNLNIREANLGMPYLTDISYYHTIDWMGQELYDDYAKYLQKSNQYQSEYTNNAKEMLEIANKIDFEENRLSLEYSVATSVNETTVGKYYVKGGTAPNYYYTEVSLPADYRANTTYYSTNTTNLQDGVDGNVRKLYEALKKYFNNSDGWKEELDGLSSSFAFMESNTIGNLSSQLNSITNEDPDQISSTRVQSSSAATAIDNFLDEMWEQVGRTPLKSLYYEQYKTIQSTNMSMESVKDGETQGNWSNPDHPNYPFYYPVVLYLNSIEEAIAKRDEIIKAYEEQYKEVQEKNIKISNELLMTNNFTEEQLVRLSPFFREDELHLDDIVETDLTTANESFKLKQDAMATGSIELQKLCQPQLQFSMTMANIYALPEFEPIIDQFQLGNIIKVGLRRDYIKQSRLLQVDLNFDNFSDFSCEFGDLTNLRTQSDIHADLLSQAISAGKNVATNSGYWTKGSDQANNIDLRLQEGLLNSIEALKNIDGTQNAYIDKYGIHLEVVNPDTGEIGDKRVWLVNNQIVFTDDGFKTSKSVLGEFTVEGETYYGLLAQAVIAGHIEGSTMIGGTIRIGDMGVDENGKRRWAFEVDQHGNVSMLGGDVQFNVTDGTNSITNSQNQMQGEIDNINKRVESVEKVTSSHMYSVEIVADGPTVISTSNDVAVLTCKVYSWDSDITNTIAAKYFKWKRTSNNEEYDNMWNGMPEHQGVKSITIDADDVIGNSSFICEVNLPGGEEEQNGN